MCTGRRTCEMELPGKRKRERPKRCGERGDAGGWQDRGRSRGREEKLKEEVRQCYSKAGRVTVLDDRH